MSKPETHAVYDMTAGGFSTRNAPGWWSDFLLTLPTEGKPGIVVVPAKEGFVVECRTGANLYATIWCPRVGDVNAFLLGPGVAFLTMLGQTKIEESLKKLTALIVTVERDRQDSQKVVK